MEQHGLRLRNTAFAFEVLPLKRGDGVVCMLPMAHMYGLAFEFLYEFAVGCHIYYLTRMPSPKIIFQAFAEVRPSIIIAVPLIIEKIIKKNVLPKLETPTMKLLLKVPFVNDKIKATVKDQVTQAFGGNFSEIIIGGAAFNQEVEQLLKMLDFPYTVGYGMTECLDALQARFVRQGGSPYGGAHPLARPGERAGRNHLPRHERHAGLL